MQTVGKMCFGVHCTGSGNIAEWHIDCRLGNSLFSHSMNRFFDQYDQYDSLWIMHIGVSSEQVAVVQGLNQQIRVLWFHYWFLFFLFVLCLFPKRNSLFSRSFSKLVLYGDN